MKPLALGLSLALLVGGCGGGGLGDRDRPDEFAISRAAPLVLPPDYELTPPKPGAPRPLAPDAQRQALDALFGPEQHAPPKSPIEQRLLEGAGATAPDPDARSTTGDTTTMVVDKGALVKSIVAAPPTNDNTSIARVTIGS